MEIKHLESDFIRSFLSLTLQKPIQEMMLHNISTSKLKYYIESDTPVALYIDTQLEKENKEAMDSIYHNIDRSLALKIERDIKKENFVFNQFQRTYLINLNIINSQEYYRELPNVLKHILIKNHTVLFTNEQDIHDTMQSICGTIGDKKYEAVYQTVQQEAFKSIRLRFTECAKYKLNDYNAELRNIEDLINKTFNEIEKLNERKMATYGKISQTLQNNSVEFDKFIDFLKRCNFVKGINIHNKTISIYMSYFPVSYTYADDAAEKLILDSANTKNNNNKELLLDALTARERFEIIHLPVVIDINVNNLEWNVRLNSLKSNIKNLSYPLLARDTGSKNRHYFSHGCLGSFQADLLNARHEGDFTKLFATILQYLQTINLADSAGQTWLYQEQIFRDKEFNVFFVYSAKTGKNYPLDKEDLNALAYALPYLDNTMSWWRD